MMEKGAFMLAEDDPRLTEVRSALLDLLERLDALGLSQAGAHLSIAINCLRPGDADCPPPPPLGPPA
jgi:hypothetical protein